MRTLYSAFSFYTRFLEKAVLCVVQTATLHLTWQISCLGLCVHGKYLAKFLFTLRDQDIFIFILQSSRVSFSAQEICSSATCPSKSIFFQFLSTSLRKLTANYRKFFNIDIRSSPQLNQMNCMERLKHNFYSNWAIIAHTTSQFIRTAHKS